jgi:nicotinamidase-related amidase
MRITTVDCVLTLVDVQERLYPVIHEAEALLERLLLLLRGLAVLGVPRIVTQQYTRGLGPTIAPVAAVLGSDTAAVEKLAFGCCDEPVYLDRLGALGRKQVVVAGIEAHVCVLQTVLGLVERGYQPVVIADAVSSRGARDRDAALARMGREGAVITTTESLLFELTRVAGTDTFRAISRLVK